MHKRITPEGVDIVVILDIAKHVAHHASMLRKAEATKTMLTNPTLLMEVLELTTGHILQAESRLNAIIEDEAAMLSKLLQPLS